MLVQHAYALGVSTVNVCGRAGENLTIVITAKDKKSKRTSNIYLLSPCGNKDETSSRHFELHTYQSFANLKP